MSSLPAVVDEPAVSESEQLWPARSCREVLSRMNGVAQLRLGELSEVPAGSLLPGDVVAQSQVDDLVAQLLEVLPVTVAEELQGLLGDPLQGPTAVQRVRLRLRTFIGWAVAALSDTPGGGGGQLSVRAGRPVGREPQRPVSTGQYL